MNHYNCNQNTGDFDLFEVAMAYVPWQHMTEIYENLEEAYHVGTIFPELNKPFTGRRCVK